MTSESPRLHERQIRHKHILMSDLTHTAGPPAKTSFEALLAGLEAAGEVTRLRLIGLLCEAELTVSELVAILGQSQPRVSRHLKLLVEAGLAERQREGAWAFYRLADKGGSLRPRAGRAHRTEPTRRSPPTARGWRWRARRAAGRPPPISPSAPRTGTRSAPCTRPRAGSKRRSAR